MNNEARNLRLSILLFFQPSAQLASARQSGPHTRIGYRSSIHACVLHTPVRSQTHTHTHTCTCVYVRRKRIRVGGSYVSKTKLMPGERELLRSRRGDETDASIPETARYTTKKRQRNLLLDVSSSVCVRVSVCVRHDGEDCVRTSDIQAS